MKSKNFIVIEGFDGSGKTTIAKWMEKELGYHYLKSPTGVFAEARKLFDDIGQISVTERLAFYAGDCIRLSEVLRQQFAGKKIVVDRYFFSTICYHEALHHGSAKYIEPIFNHLLQPDLIFFIKADYEIIIERLKLRQNSDNDQLISSKFYQKVENEYKRYIHLPGSFIINNNEMVDKTFAQIRRLL